MGRKSREKKERKAKEIQVLYSGSTLHLDYSAAEARTMAALQAAFAIPYNRTSKPNMQTTYYAWQLQMLNEMTDSTQQQEAWTKIEEENMCGSCAAMVLTKSHDPNTMARFICKLCRTDWPGIEPGNDRRGAIMAQRKAH
jgi:formate dehydrogenase maturation protein FdhE